MSIRYDFAAVSARIVDHLLRKNRRNEVSRLIRRLHPADRAAIYLSLNRHAQGAYLSVLTCREFASLLLNLDDEMRLRLVRQSERLPLTRALDHMSGDQASDVLQSMPANEARAVLAGMRTRGRVAPLLAHPPETADE